MPRTNYYTQSVFINYPIDEEYKPLFRAMAFSILRCGFFVRGALEDYDSSNIRINKILQMIRECRFGIHDLSRTKLCDNTNLPRFNMPFELGLFLGAKYFESEDRQRSNKKCLIFEGKEHSYEKYISDIKGQDIESHNNRPEKMIPRIRDWLVNNSKKKNVPGGHRIYEDYKKFKIWLPKECKQLDLKIKDLLFIEYLELVVSWLLTRRINGKIYKKFR